MPNWPGHSVGDYIELLAISQSRHYLWLYSLCNLDYVGFGVQVGTTFAGQQPIIYNPQVAQMPSQPYFHPNGQQYGQLVGHPRQVFYMPNYQPETQYKGRNYWLLSWLNSAKFDPCLKRMNSVDCVEFQMTRISVASWRTSMKFDNSQASWLLVGYKLLILYSAIHLLGFFSFLFSIIVQHLLNYRLL